MITSIVRPAGIVAAAVLGLVLLVGGCGGATDTLPQAPPSAPPAQAAPAAQPAPAVADSPTAGQAPAATPAPVPDAAPPAGASPAPAATAAPDLPVQDHEIAGVQVALVEARRTGGETVTVKWQYRNTTPRDVRVSKGGTSWADAYQLTADAYLIDSVNKKKYLVIRDAQNYWVASKHGDWQGMTLAPGQSLNAWAKFPAPPVTVEKIAVSIPGTAPFEDVPIVK